MKSTIIICSVLSFLGAVIKFITASAGKEKTSYLINTFIGGTIILSLLSFVTGNGIPNFELANADYSREYENISAEVIDGIIASTENEIEKIISEEILIEFGITPYDCEVLIDYEKLTIKKAELYFSSDSAMISNYEIVSYLKNKYELEVEVIVT